LKTVALSRRLYDPPKVSWLVNKNITQAGKSMRVFVRVCEIDHIAQKRASFVFLVVKKVVDVVKKGGAA
jgi:hypothetical protein